MPDPTNYPSPERELRDVLAAVLEALDIPNAATVGDQETRDRILVERASHAAVTLRRVLGDTSPGPGWEAAYLRERLAENPAAGYKTWAEGMTALDAARAADGGAR